MSLHAHLLTCRNCIISYPIFCDRVPEQTADEMKRRAKDDPAKHDEYVTTIARERVLRGGK